MHNRVRGLSPRRAHGSDRYARKMERVKVLRTQVVEGTGPPGAIVDDAFTIACGEGAVRVLEVQRSGKRPMAAGEFLRGFPLGRGTRLRGPG